VAVRTRGVGSRRWLPAAVIGIVLTIGALLGADAVADAHERERREGLERSGDALAHHVESALERGVTDVELLARSGGNAATFRTAALARLQLAPGLRMLALGQLDDGALPVQAVVPQDQAPFVTGADLYETSEIAPVLVRAVDEADPTAGSPFRFGGDDVITLAAPVLDDPGASGEATRRDAVQGVVVGALDADAVLAPAWSGRHVLVSPSGRALGDEAATGDLLTRTIDVNGRAWQLRLDEPEGDGWPASAWVVLGAGVTIALLLAIAYERERRARDAAEREAAARSLQLERIAEASARLQQSLDLAELLPTFAVALANDFDLQAVSISLLDDNGALIEAFATGEQTGTSIDLPLRRGWRAVGVLGVRPGRRLDGSELTSLQALADLLAVAMSNAQLYEREQLNAARLRDLDALKNAFLGTVSHELRTSMTAIMGFGEMLSESWDDLDDDRRREMADRIRRSAGSLRHLVDDLLDFARLEQERLRVSPRTVDLSGIVRQTVEGLSPLLRNHEVVMDLDPALRAWADPVAVERILANLVSNAAKYSPAGSTVTVTTTATDGRARLVVADQGPGIPPEERRRIFSRFYRLETPESVRTRGAGIGLAILADFADRSHAAVVVDDAPGGGARFTVDFPTEPVPGTDELAIAT
jgi:signal transduction histidine kinase